MYVCINGTQWVCYVRYVLEIIELVNFSWMLVLRGFWWVYSLGLVKVDEV